MIGFSIGELGCPSLEYVYDMSWAEFLIRSFAYRRTEINDWRKVRRIAYASLMGSHADPKKLPRNEQKYMPLDDKKEISDEHRKRGQEAMLEYLKQKKDA